MQNIEYNSDYLIYNSDYLIYNFVLLSSQQIFLLNSREALMQVYKWLCVNDAPFGRI